MTKVTLVRNTSLYGVMRKKPLEEEVLNWKPILFQVTSSVIKNHFLSTTMYYMVRNLLDEVYFGSVH